MLGSRRQANETSTSTRRRMNTNTLIKRGCRDLLGGLSLICDNSHTTTISAAPALDWIRPNSPQLQQAYFFCLPSAVRLSGD